MEIIIKKEQERSIRQKQEMPNRLYNPEGMNFKKELRIKFVEFHDKFTRVDFVVYGSKKYTNGGWIQIDSSCYMESVDTGIKYTMLCPIKIPKAPKKFYFSKQGQRHEYSLLFPALPKTTKRVHIIEKDAPCNYFNFYNLDFASWMLVPHPSDLTLSNN